jgi:hypothetical protein
MPTGKAPDFKVGLDYGDTSLRAKLLTNLRSVITEADISYLVQSDLILGANLIIDPQIQSVTKYDFGISWTPALNQLVGLKHESLNKNNFELGKFVLMFHHYATDN